MLHENACVPAMPPKKVAKSAMQKTKAKAIKKTKPMKVKGSKKKPAASSAPHTQGRSEFNSAACNGAKTQPLGGLTGFAAMCDLAHAGAPASEELRDVRPKALLQTYKVYEKDAVSEWASKDCLQSAPSCLLVFQPLHEEYDRNNQPKDADTHMVAFFAREEEVPKTLPEAGPQQEALRCIHPLPWG